MHLLSSVSIQPNLELKTQPKQLLGSLPLVIALPEQSYLCRIAQGGQGKYSQVSLSPKGKYHCTIDLLFDRFGLVCFANKNKNFK